MPAIIFYQGWRFSFFANEGNEPIHIHARKGDKQCKYWLHPETFCVSEAYTRGMNTRDKRHVIKIIM
ncbi:MAG: DUF4160 domain-containing protein, partial [Ignavibacteriae bacterium]|nr:DUF4160 domain-containing protein [Ignavibacteriota bacterium]